MKFFHRDWNRDRTPAEPLLPDDTRFASGRVALFQYLTVAVFLFLISGFWDLQVRNPGIYSERADRNRIKAHPILAPRGKILDRDGRLIVDNRSSFSLALSREDLKPEQLSMLAEALHLDYDELVKRLDRFKSRPQYEPVIIKEELTPGEVAFVEAHRNSENLPEMELIQAHRRQYPNHSLAAHVIGYTGEVSEAELNTREFVLYEQGDVIGKAGIEREYNDVLMGVDGERRVLVDNRGRARHEIGVKEAIPGRPLQLTLDLDLQAVAELAMENRRGSVVALDPRNGEVLAMVSRPAYDPNKFTKRILPRDWKELTGNPENPLLNRSIQAQLAPGSTFKPVVALAALETGAIEEDFNVRCNGGANMYGRYFKCHKPDGHGMVDLHTGLVQSCDVFFYNAGNRVGIDRIAHYAELVGLGKKTGIDLPNEEEGLVPSTAWKMRTYRQKWYAGETISVAIGQGALTVTPLQLAHAIGGLAMGGVWYRPHLVKQDNGAEEPRRASIAPANVAKIVSGMYGVVNEGGTGVRAHLPGIELCGKTGTAQLASNQFLRNNKAGESMMDNAWFVGFAPREEPEIVVVALFEGGQHGNLAAPIVRDVAKAYFDKKARNTQRQLMADLQHSATSDAKAAAGIAPAIP